MKCGDLILLKNAVTAHLQKEHTQKPLRKVICTFIYELNLPRPVISWPHVLKKRLKNTS